MNADPNQARKKNRGRAAAAAAASAALLIPAGTAHSADRLSKKLNKKAVKAKIRHNIAVLKRRMRAHPELALRAETTPEVSTGYGLPQQAPRRGRATTSQVATQCKANDAFDYKHINNPVSPDAAIAMSWNSNSTCSGKPVKVTLTTNMVAPNGVNHPDSDVGVNSAHIAKGENGPVGTWNYFRSVTWVISPPNRWKSAQGACAGVGTNVVTCKNGYSIPTA
jgi:hypothetical protein